MADAVVVQRVPSLVTTSVVVVSAVFPLLSLITILFRYKARRVARLQLQSDDWWIVISWFLTIPLSINVWTFGSIMGIDYYKIDPMKGTQKSLMCILISSTILQPALASVKISVLLFYKRIFSKGSTTFGIVAWVGIVVVGCWGIIFFFMILLCGNPVSTAWTGVGTFRYDAVQLGYAQSGTSIALDFVVLAYPLPVIFGLHMDAKRKIAVMFIFWLGAFCAVAAITRLVLLRESLELVAQSKGFEAVYNQAKQFCFMILEPNCSIIAACLPCYGPLFAHGRGMESILRSVRSVFSLRSRSSPHGSDNSRNWTPGQPKVSDVDGSIALISSEGISQHTNEEHGGRDLQEIRVTKGYQVRTESKRVN
ncbi:uncharacterized protein BDR25DRAFT_338822 [Lindgomyces ingoldianus]|uniref:Uncharacterized protein n=1 Tax=Lindgomyces ingoldianus TaxID=673940 RepID=A0ACB6RI39_9PLEO|nr:uncharacterized protein BDR25DRAFT_338822 [Lindgomyces ingoldianus]KAF2478182.1 hypothetical protein BDR25DRAFT_338822 [Lindgomyces ingoldianus]